MKRFVIGDIHGAHKAFVQCLERASFDHERDLLISLGDVCDGWPEVDKVLEAIIHIKHHQLILGNHDEWTLRWMTEGWMGYEWVSQGGKATLVSYKGNRETLPTSHVKLLKNALLYFEIDNKLFVHGGVDPDLPLAKQDGQFLMWDRTLFSHAVETQKTHPEFKYGKWDDIFIGHTTTQRYRKLTPVHACNVWALDTGGGWSGKLTIMNIDTHEYWQSDLVPALYPGIAGRE